MKDMKVSHLLMMAGMHFVAMYALMYVMVNVVGNIYLNINNFYMAILMTSPMLVIESIMMKSMYKNKAAINAILIGSMAIFALSFIFIRNQTLVGDREFLKSMVPHHAGAILMCNKADIKDPEIKKLCESIISSQKEEINIMKTKLEKLN